MTYEFFVAGTPKAQARPRAFARQFGNKWQARVYDAGTAENWKSLIAQAAKQYVPTQPLLGAVCLEIVFYLPRPKSHFHTSKKKSGQLRSDAPTWHTSKSDWDNYGKAASDALTQIGFWRDDSQLAKVLIIKQYAHDKMYSPGAHFLIKPLSFPPEHDAPPGSDGPLSVSISKPSGPVEAGAIASAAAGSVSTPNK